LIKDSNYIVKSKGLKSLLTTRREVHWRLLNSLLLIPHFLIRTKDLDFGSVQIKKSDFSAKRLKSLKWTIKGSNNTGCSFL